MLKLMIVDDQAWARTGLEQGINWSELNIEVCASCNGGTQALSCLQHMSVDILLTDIRMADMDGLKLADVVSRDYPHIAIVFMSAYQEFEYAFQAMRLGVKAYVLKPVDPDELIKTMLGVVNLISGKKTPEPVEKAPEVHDVVRRAKEYVHNHIASRQINLKETAEALHVNYYYLSKCFKRDEKCTFTSYVNNIRLKIARGLLKSTDLTVVDICQQIGMEPKYFHEIFSRKTGVSPLEYRALGRKAGYTDYRS